MTNPHDVIIRPVVTEHSMAEMGEKKYKIGRASCRERV